MTIKHAEFENVAYLQFGAITNLFQTVGTLTDNASELALINSTNAIIRVKLPQLSGNTVIQVEMQRMPPFSTFTYSGRANKKTVCQGPIQIAYDGDAPSSGEFSYSAIR